MQNIVEIIKNKKILYLLILVIAIIITVSAVLLVTSFKPFAKNILNPKTNTQTLPNETPKLVKLDNKSKETMVKITKQGFFPQTVKIKKGTSVTWSNDEDALHQIKSDPHPLDNKHPLLNTDAKLGKNERISVNFEKEGSYTYHDELNPLKFKGIIIVE